MHWLKQGLTDAVSSAIEALEKGPKSSLDAAYCFLIKAKDPRCVLPLLSLKMRLKGSDYEGPSVVRGVPLARREQVVQAALVELAQAAPEPFIQVIDQEEHPLRWAAIHVLAEARVDGLFHFLKRQFLEKPGRHKVLLLDAIANQEDPDRMAFLGQLLGDRDEAVVYRVIFLLKESRDPKALPYVRKALRDLAGDPRMMRLLLKRLEQQLESLTRTMGKAHLTVVEGPDGPSREGRGYTRRLC